MLPMRYLFCFLLICISCFSFGQPADTAVAAPSAASRVRISVLTCGVGEELYSSFGHNGIRVIDSSKGLDEVYNYGTFNYSDPNFYVKFLRGKLLYYLDKSSYDRFIYTYIEEKRNIQEQVLDLSPEQKLAVVTYLEH